MKDWLLSYRFTDTLTGQRLIASTLVRAESLHQAKIKLTKAMLEKGIKEEELPEIGNNTIE